MSKPTGTARLTHGGKMLVIAVQTKKGVKTDTYTIEDAGADPQLASKCFNLTKADGTQYCVAMTGTGLDCTCPNFLKRHNHLCKHLRAMAAVGLLPVSFGDKP